MGWACGMKGERRCAYGVMVGKPEGKSPLWRRRYRWRMILILVLNKYDWKGGGVDWIDLAQDRDKWRVLAKAVVGSAINCGDITCWGTVPWSYLFVIVHGVDCQMWFVISFACVFVVCYPLYFLCVVGLMAVAPLINNTEMNWIITIFVISIIILLTEREVAVLSSFVSTWRERS